MAGPFLMSMWQVARLSSVSLCSLGPRLEAVCQEEVFGQCLGSTHHMRQKLSYRASKTKKKETISVNVCSQAPGVVETQPDWHSQLSDEGLVLSIRHIRRLGMREKGTDLPFPLGAGAVWIASPPSVCCSEGDIIPCQSHLSISQEKPRVKVSSLPPLRTLHLVMGVP